MQKIATVEQFIRTERAWKAELAELRAILRREAELEETIKWGSPVYTLDGKNVVGIGAFKSYFGLWFFQGALLADKKKVLLNAQEGRTRAMRQLRLQSMDQIDRKLIGAYVREAIGLVRQGIEIKPVRNQPLEVPAELQVALRRHGKAGTSFKKMTPGKRREYAEYVASAKRDETRQKRVEKILPMIESGIGLNDKYRSG